MSATTPDGTNCSDQTMPPLPPVRSSGPMMKADRHWVPVGRAAPRTRRKAYMREPAMTKRKPPTRNGGTVSMANRMARYVEPQMR